MYSDTKKIIEEQKHLYRQELLQKKEALKSIRNSGGKTKIILWDWDNTLADTFGAIWIALNKVNRRYGLSLYSRAEAKKAMNTSVVNTAKKLLGEEKAEEFNSFFWDNYAQHINQIKLMPGAEEVLKYTHSLGCINILASNKISSLLLREVNRFNLLAHFDHIIGAGDAIEDKPSKKFTDKAMEGFYNNGVIISVGDGLSDIKMAHNYSNGISILVLSDPNKSEFEKEKPDYCVQNLTDCKSVLQKLIQGQKLPQCYKKRLDENKR